MAQTVSAAQPPVAHRSPVQERAWRRERRTSRPRSLGAWRLPSGSPRWHWPRRPARSRRRACSWDGPPPGRRRLL